MIFSMRKIFAFLFTTAFITGQLFGQNNMGIGTTTPNSNSLLELDNNGNPLGLLLPRQDRTTFALGATDRGMMVFDPTDGKVYTWDGFDWLSSTSEWILDPGNNLYTLVGGNVGIGTNNPLSKLSIAGNLAVGAPFAGSQAAPADGLAVRGNTGIGISTPVNRLGVAGSAAIGTGFAGVATAQPNGLIVEENVGIGYNGASDLYQLRVDIPNTNTTTRYAGYFLNSYNGGVTKYGIYSDVDIQGTSNKYGVYSVVTQPAGNSNSAFGYYTLVNHDGTGAAYGNYINTASSATTGTVYGVYATGEDRNYFSGDVGVGTTAPVARLHVAGDVYAANGVFATAGSSPLTASTNTDHIWHDDGPNAWNFVSDGTYKETGNSLLNAGRASLNAGTGGQNALNITSNSTWGTAINISNTDGGATPDTYSMVVAGTAHPTVANKTFAILQGTNPVIEIAPLFNIISLDPSGVTLVGIGTDVPDQQLTVDGQASKPGGGFWATFSDRRLKRDIRSFEDGLDELMQINPVRYKYNESSGFKDISQDYVGVIAQDIQQVLPYTVSANENKKAPDGSGYLTYDSSSLLYVLVNAVKELNEKVEKQQLEIEGLRNQTQTPRED